MRYYRLRGGPGLVARRGDEAYDLAGATPALRRFRDLAAAAAATDAGIDDVAARHLDDAEPVALNSLDGAGVPLCADEVWAAGVTYEISERAREEESAMPDIYLDVYGAERPEVFFKATSSRTVGPGEAVGVRADSDWNVPEPELGVVLYAGEVVGYTVGNDVSSRDIEGRNPLYLPQAKVYDRCCALGPCVASPGTVGDPGDLGIEMEIVRDGEVAFEGATSTSSMVRTVDELVSCLTRHDAVPETAVLLTGTSLVPPDEFTLREGDEVRVRIESIGALENAVVEV